MCSYFRNKPRTCHVLEPTSPSMKSTWCSSLQQYGVVNKRAILWFVEFVPPLPGMGLVFTPPPAKMSSLPTRRIITLSTSFCCWRRQCLFSTVTVVDCHQSPYLFSVLLQWLFPLFGWLFTRPFVPAVFLFLVFFFLAVGRSVFLPSICVRFFLALCSFCTSIFL